MTEKFYKVSHTELKAMMSYAIFTMAAADGIKKWAEDADKIVAETYEEITNG